MEQANKKIKHSFEILHLNETIHSSPQTVGAVIT